jgi:hypothetical protein
MRSSVKKFIAFRARSQQWQGTIAADSKHLCCSLDPPEQQRLRKLFNSVVTCVHEGKELCAEAAVTVHFHTCVSPS